MCAKKNKPPRGLTITEDELYERWTGFQRKYPTDEDCIEEILNLGNFDARICLKCGSTEKLREKGSPLARCQECKKAVYLFNGTFFERLRKPRAYLAALWLRSEQIGISSNRFAKLVHIAQSTAFGIQKKIDTVIFEAMMEDAIGAYSGHFREIMTKRSSETPAREHAVSEQDLVDAEQRAKAQSRTKNSDRRSTSNDSRSTDHNSAQSKGNSESDHSTDSAEAKSSAEAESSTEAESNPDFDQAAAEPELHDLILDLLSETNAVHADDLVESLDVPVGEILASLLELTLNKKVIDLGSLYFKKSKEDTNDLLGLAKFFDIDEKSLERFFAQVQHVFHGVSRKNLQLYLAWFWSLVSTAFKDPANLIAACSKFRHLTRHEVREFVTEPMVNSLLNNQLNSILSSRFKSQPCSAMFDQGFRIELESAFFLISITVTGSAIPKEFGADID